MKIAIISSTFPDEKPGGVSTYVEGRAEFLSRKIEVQVYALGGNSGYQGIGRLKEIGIGSHMNFSRNFPIYWWRLLKGVISFKPDIIEIHNIPVGLPLFVLSFFVKLGRITYFFHGPARLESQIEGASNSSVFMRYQLEKFCLKRSKVIYCVSHAFQEVLLKEHPFIKKRGLVVRLRYPRLLFPTQIENKIFHNDSLSFVCVRRLVKRTGVLDLIDAFIGVKKMGKIHKTSTLNIVGSGPLLEEIEERVESSGYSSSIKVLGKISSKARDELYQKSSFNIVPTKGLEGFGLIILEAAFFGCPSIVTRVNALPEVIEKLDGLGVVCQPGKDGLKEVLANIKPFTDRDREKLFELSRRKFGVNR